MFKETFVRKSEQTFFEVRFPEQTFYVCEGAGEGPGRGLFRKGCFGFGPGARKVGRLDGSISWSFLVTVHGGSKDGPAAPVRLVELCETRDCSRGEPEG